MPSATVVSWPGLYIMRMHVGDRAACEEGLRDSVMLPPAPPCRRPAAALLAFHAAASCMLGAALGGFDTAFWYQLATR